MPRASLKTIEADRATEFEAAQSEFKAVQGKHMEMCGRLETMKLAQNYAGAKDITKTNAPAHLQERAKPFMKLAGRRPEKFREQIEDLWIEIEEHQPFYTRANEIWQAAMQAETARIAIELQPRHREAVRNIATAFEDLSKAIADEQALHAELKQTAPLPVSNYMPRLTDEFGDICLSVWGSRAWRWVRHVKKLKII